ncbi:MAG: type II secretion system GspH family protein [Candidatus Omnitrophica bacterium]|nr:type II secretion system GspH family protein [Candidatus Omnitrophota bacterium]
MKKKFWTGFTLIEITAVVGIVSTLSVGTYMGVQKGRERECINNLQQIHKAIVMFEMDNGHLPYIKFFPASSSDPKGLNNILSPYGITGSILFCPSIPEQLNRYGTNYIWNDTVNGKSVDSLPSNTWLMTEMTAVSKNIPGPHTGRFSILYAGGNAQIGERIYLPDVATPPTQKEEEKRPIKVEEKKAPELQNILNILTKKEARAGEKIKISVSISDGKGNSLPIKPGIFSITADDASVDIPSTFEVKSETFGFEFSSIFNKTGKFRIKVKEENSGLEGECEINILPESVSQFSFSNFPLLWEAGKPQIVYINACDKSGNRTDEYNGEITILARDGRTSPEKIMMAKGVWTGEITLTKSSENNVLYAAGERNIFGKSPEFKVKNTVPSYIELSPESKIEPVAGASYDITMEVKDMYGNRCIDYTGEIDIGLPEGATTETKKVVLGTEDSGKKRISITFFKAGDKKIQVSTKEIRGEKEFYVNPGQLYSFSIGEIGTQEAGKSFSIVVKGTDKWGNTVKGYYLKEPSGTMEYIKRDTSSGMWMETVLIKKAGEYTLLVENSSGITGNSNIFIVKPSSPEKIEITGIPIELIQDKEYSGNIIVKDRFENIINDYQGSFIVESEGLKAEINGLNIKVIPEKSGYYKLILKDAANSKLSTEKHLVISNQK